MINFTFSQGHNFAKINKCKSISYYSIKSVILFMILCAGPDQPEKHTESHAFLHQYPCGTEDSNQVENGLKCQIFSYISYILRQVI